MHAHLKLAAEQDELFSRWQLLTAGWDRDQVKRVARRERWQVVHPGVYTRSQGPLTRRQLHRAATLTAPFTYLHYLSGADLHGVHTWAADYETVVRPGSGGKRRHPGLLVAHSLTLEGSTGWVAGIPVVSPERVMVELAATLTDLHLGRAFRESCRLGCCTQHSIAKSLKGQRGTSLLAALCHRYGAIPYWRCRSDAESRGLEVLYDAGIPLPEVNVGVAGREADFVWRERRLIVEVMSKEFHPFEIDDLEKKQRWEAAGYTVRYAWPVDIYDHPGRLVAICSG